MTETPKLVDGIRCYAPELLESNTGFPPGRFARLHAAEIRNFWYRSRARIIRRIVLARLKTGDEFLELGCGTGSLLEEIGRDSGLRLMGAEIYLDALQMARERMPGAEFVQMDARHFPFHDRFHGVGMFDVLEHIDEDEIVMKQVFDALRPGGWFFVTVPQHRWLWSTNDDAAYHRRRYTRRELSGKLTRAGFDVRFATSFVTTLFPMMVVTRFAKRGRAPVDPYDAVLRELELPAFANTVLELGMRVDETAIRAGASLPFGGSLLAVARRPLNQPARAQ